MTLYSDHPAHRLRQVVGDVLVLTWIIGWVLVGRAVHATVARLAAPGRTLESAGSSLESGLADAGAALSGVPLVGGDLATPFEAAGGAAGAITDAGVGIQEGVAQAALLAALAVAGWPIVVALVVWLRVRLRFARRATAARRLLTSGADLDLFALRGLARLPLPALARVSADPAGDWRRGDPDVVRTLAGLELQTVGLRLPAADLSR